MDTNKQFVDKSLQMIHSLALQLDELSLGTSLHDLSIATDSLFLSDLFSFLLYLVLEKRNATIENLSENEILFLRSHFSSFFDEDQIDLMLKNWDINIHNYTVNTLQTWDVIGMADRLLCEEGGTACFAENIMMHYTNIGMMFVLINNDNCLKTAEKVKRLGNTLSKIITHNGYHSGNENDETSLQDLLQELHSLTGLNVVKRDLCSLIDLLQVNRQRELLGIQQSVISLHLVFSGNSGTGKTMVARLLAKIYKVIGILSQGHLVEVDRSGLVAGYVGQTALKVKDVIDRAKGGILFIDEAYSLTSSMNNVDFGQEAIDTLLKYMEDYRDDLVIVVAGYPDLMENFLNSNPGLRSRFNQFIHFDDYSPDEMVSIFKYFCSENGMVLSDEAETLIVDLFRNRFTISSHGFANARTARNFFEKVILCQAKRVAAINEVSREVLTIFHPIDITNALNLMH